MCPAVRSGCADPYGAYVLRLEGASLAAKLHGNELPDYLDTGKDVPVVYQLDLRNADGLLLAQSFIMRDHHLVYVSDARAVRVGKLAGLFNSVAAIFKDNSFNAYTAQFKQ